MHEGKVMNTRILPKFEYYEPKSLQEALALISRFGDKSRILAGGTDLIPLMKMGRLAPDYIININTLAELHRIEYGNMGLRIGAAATFGSLERSLLVREKYPSLFEACRSVGSVQIRNMGTVGGNLCRAAPSADVAPPLIVLGAEVKSVSLSGERTTEVEDFLTGPGETILKSDELLTEISVPPVSAHMGTAFLKLARTAFDLSTVNVAVGVTEAGGICEEVKIALGAVAPKPIRAKKAEGFLRGKNINNTGIIEAASIIAANEAKPITDVRATADYRREASKILVRRALEKASFGIGEK